MNISNGIWYINFAIFVRFSSICRQRLDTTCPWQLASLNPLRISVQVNTLNTPCIQNVYQCLWWFINRWYSTVCSCTWKCILLYKTKAPLFSLQSLSEYVDLIFLQGFLSIHLESLIRIMWSLWALQQITSMLS